MTHQAPQQMQAHPAKKKRRWPLVLLGALAVFVMIGVAVNVGRSPSRDDPTGAPAGNEISARTAAEQHKATEHVIVYRVTGTGSATSVTYTTDGMTTTNQEQSVALPWAKTIKLPVGEPLQMVSILAQGGSEDSAIDVRIEVDGTLFKEAHAQGYGVASANGSIGELR